MSSGTLTAAAGPRRNRGEPGRGALERGIVQAVAYADVFEYPLTADEIHRYLVGVAASRGAVRAVLSAGRPQEISRQGRYYTLEGRESIIDIRRARAAAATQYWRCAIRYGRTMGSLPFVRMVAVTGALAMDNMADGDIDYLVVTEPGRLWLCRALIVGLVRLAARKGTELCPNYFLSEQALALNEHNLFTAHEIAQMVPITSMQTYERLRALNRWTDTYLPNAGSAPHRIGTVEPPRRRMLESALRSPVCAPLERWEMNRKIRKLDQRRNGHAEVAFGPDWCKGHFGDHGQVTLARYAERLRALERRQQ